MWHNKEILREWVGDKKELHLLSLGQLGTLTEIIDSNYMLEIKMTDDNKITINPRCLDKESLKRKAYRFTENLVHCELFEHFLKIKKKHGTFTIYASLLFIEDDWFDEDNTVTINATKYHKVMLGKHGAIIIHDITFDKPIDDIDKDDVLQRMKLIFNINKYIGFSCFIQDDLIPTQEHDICTNVDKDDFTKSITKLARGTKSMLNGKIDVKDCIVVGYATSKKNDIFSSMVFHNDLWDKKQAQNTRGWIEIVRFFHDLGHISGFRDLTENDLEEFVQKCRDFLYDDTLPRGVRKSRFEMIDEFLMKLSKKVKDMVYLKYYNKLITPPTD